MLINLAQFVIFIFCYRLTLGDHAPIVRVQQGLLKGQKLKMITDDGYYYSFKGIPYAAPPVGDLRFKHPQPALPWLGIRNAEDHGPICPQVDVLFTQQYLPGSEDCLFLNVYTPILKPKHLLPVLFFIHGGAFKTGSGNSDIYGPDFLVKEDIVVVTINYRLDVLGQLCLDTKDVPGNAAQKDQVEALRWVQNNIKQFGGDPSQVTIMGQSSGSASASLHLFSPLSKCLFHRAILMSGVGTCDWSLSFQPRRRAFVLGKELGANTTDAGELLEFLQQLPVENLINRDANLFAIENLEQSLLFNPFVPVVEKDLGLDHFLTTPISEMLNLRPVNDVDIMIGYTQQESSFFIDVVMDAFQVYDQFDELFSPTKISLKVSPPKNLETGDKIRYHYLKNKSVSNYTLNEMFTFFSEHYFVYDIAKFLERLPPTKRRYLYQFSYVSERNIFSAPAAKLGVKGASHLEDLLYLFTWTAQNLTINKESDSFCKIQEMTKLYTNFVKFGNPTPDRSLGVTWNSYNLSTKSFMNISDNLQPGKRLREDVIKFYDSVYLNAFS